MPKLPNFITNPKWFHVTRALGILCVLYGLFVDRSADRGSIILGGFGLLGLEKVAKSENKDDE